MHVNNSVYIHIYVMCIYIYESESITQLCPTLCDTMDYSPPGSSVHGILHAGYICIIYIGFPSGSDSKEFSCNVGDLGSIPKSGGCPGEGNGHPLQYCLKNPMDRGAWQATVRGIAKSRTQLKQLSTHAYIYMYY